MDVSVIFKSIMSVLNELDTHVFNSFLFDRQFLYDNHGNFIYVMIEEYFTILTTSDNYSNAWRYAL